MTVTVLAFGIAREIINNSSIELALPAGATTATLKKALSQRYPKLNNLASFAIAVNNEYTRHETAISEGDEIAIIPPVSGG